MKLEVYFEPCKYANILDCYFILSDHNGKKQVAAPMELKFEPLDAYIDNKPTLRFSGPEVAGGLLQAFVDGLARVGYRYESSDVGELKATKIHLEDMRKLVFK